MMGLEAWELGSPRAGAAVVACGKWAEMGLGVAMLSPQQLVQLAWVSLGRYG